MAFIRTPGLSGKLYVPEPGGREHSKRPCPDCFGCQQCSDTRCGVCRGACPPEEPAAEKDP
jgi:hypothetical protein